MNIIKRLKYNKNSKRLLDICSQLILKYESENNVILPSCKDDVISLITIRVRKAEEEISEWQDYDTDYIKIAHSLLAHACFDLLASGNYHLYIGMLNPMSCAANILFVYDRVLGYGVKSGEIAPETKEEQKQLLVKQIQSVG